MKKLLMNQKLVITVFSVLIVGLALFALVPMVVALVMGPGVRTEPVNAENAEPATTGVDGEWVVVEGRPPNTSSVGFTFDEVLPGERTRTSGSTQDVSGAVTIEEGALTAGEIVVDLTNIVTDRDVRDENVRNKLLETHDYPEATFEITEPANLSEVPDNGALGEVELGGELTIKGNTNEVVQPFQVLRDGEFIIVSGDVVIDRNAYGVESPEMIAADIADEGEINIRVALGKDGQE